MLKVLGVIGTGEWKRLPGVATGAGLNCTAEPFVVLTSCQGYTPCDPVTVITPFLVSKLKSYEYLMCGASIINGFPVFADTLTFRMQPLLVTVATGGGGARPVEVSSIPNAL